MTVFIAKASRQKVLDIWSRPKYYMFNPHKWRWMAFAIGVLWALFLCLDELLPENPPSMLIILPL